ncbi:MAG TPA: hypothetical protein PLM16_00595 [Candidatus Woesebacteria bacterium]|nr:hypothetical protein [Candidatus Woesebacteria bacterium]
MNKLQKVAMSASAAVSGLLASAGVAMAQLGTVVVPEKGFAKSLGSIFSSALNLVVLIAAVLVFLYLIMGGIEWITSGGDKGQTEKARNKITAAIIGLIILAASYALLQLVLSLLGFTGGINEVFQFGIKPINN